MRQTNQVSIRALVWACALLTGAPGAAMAQAQDGSALQTPSGGGMDIVVTAEKRETRLLETPLAIAAIPTQQVERQGIDSFEDLQAVTPSLTFGKFSNFGIASLRGIGTDFGTISAEPSVSIFQDGVYLGPSSAQNIPTFDLERIEVLRGPQGTLYGRNSLGGTINFITRNPSFTPQMNAIFELGKYSTGSAAVGLTGPIGSGDIMAARISGRLQIRDGYRRNDFLNRRADDLNSVSVNGSLLFQPSSNFKLIIRGDYTKMTTSQPYARIQDSLNYQAIFGGSFTPDPANTTRFRNDTLTSSKFKAWGLSATAELEIGNVTVRSITAYRENSLTSLEDWDGSDANILTFGLNDQFTQLTEEVNVLGSSFDGRLDWVFGVFYYDATGKTTAPTGGLLYSQLLGFNSLTFIGDQDSSSIAGFFQATAHLSDKLNLTGGLRYTKDKKTLVQSLVVDQAVDTCGVTRSKKWDAWTGTVSADYEIMDNSIVYVRAARGFKAGGINLAQCGDVFDPEKLDSLEIGIRGSVLGGALSGALTAFYYDYKGIQITSYAQTSAAIDNVAGGTIKGIELELNAMPARGLRIDGSLSYLDSAYDRFATQDSLLTGPYQIGGNPLIRAPKWRGNIGVEYAFDLGAESTLTLRGETSCSDQYYHDTFRGQAALQSQTREPGYTISNFRLIWKANEKFELQAFVENIENHQYAYRRFSSSSFGGVIGQFSPPRTFGLRASVRLGD